MASKEWKGQGNDNSSGDNGILIEICSMKQGESSEDRLSALWDAVLNLALPANEQIAILEAIGERRAVDELALDYDDNCWMFNEPESRSALTREELSALRSLDRRLDRMSGEANAGNWTVEALRFSDCWKEIRKLAAAALATRQIAKVKKSAA